MIKVHQWKWIDLVQLVFTWNSQSSCSFSLTILFFLESFYFVIPFKFVNLFFPVLHETRLEAIYFLEHLIKWYVQYHLVEKISIFSCNFQSINLIFTEFYTSFFLNIMYLYIYNMCKFIFFYLKIISTVVNLLKELFIIFFWIIIIGSKLHNKYCCWIESYLPRNSFNNVQVEGSTVTHHKFSFSHDAFW